MLFYTLGSILSDISFLSVVIHLNYVKSSIVTFGEAKCVHCQSMNERDWVLRNDSIDDLYEYRNLGVLKNYTVKTCE